MLAIDSPGKVEPCPAPFNLSDYVLWQNGAADERIAMEILGNSGSEKWSYGKLRDQTLRTAAGLIEFGLRPGDRLFLRLGNTPDFPVVFLAAIAVGVLPVPISDALNKEEIQRLFRSIEPAAVIGEFAGAISPKKLLSSKPIFAPIFGEPNRPAYLICTSGTSGSPMAVLHAHRAIWARRSMISGWYQLTKSDRMLHAGAFNWTYTLGTGLFDPWTVGATALLPGDGLTFEDLPTIIQQHDATIFAAAPGVFRKLVRLPFPDVPTLRHALTAGEKMPDSLIENWTNSTGTHVHEAFGQTECSTFISGAPDRPSPKGTLGYAQPGRHIAILGEDGPVKRGKAGRIAIKGSDPGVMLKYWDDPEKTSARHKDGWFITGDTGVMTDDGAVIYHGREDDVMTAGGYRISPVEVENAMIQHPKIDDAAAVDERVSEDTTVVAIHYSAHAPLDEDDLKKHSEAHLARYKQPRVFHFHKELPRGAGGKLLRVQLRAEKRGS